MFQEHNRDLTPSGLVCSAVTWQIAESRHDFIGTIARLQFEDDCLVAGLAVAIETAGEWTQGKAFDSNRSDRCGRLVVLDRRGWLVILDLGGAGLLNTVRLGQGRFFVGMFLVGQKQRRLDQIGLVTAGQAEQYTDQEKGPEIVASCLHGWTSFSRTA